MNYKSLACLILVVLSVFYAVPVSSQMVEEEIRYILMRDDSVVKVDVRRQSVLVHREYEPYFLIGRSLYLPPKSLAIPGVILGPDGPIRYDIIYRYSGEVIPMPVLTPLRLPIHRLIGA